MVWKDRSGSINRYMFSRIPAVSALKYLVTIRIIYGTGYKISGSELVNEATVVSVMVTQKGNKYWLAG